MGCARWRRLKKYLNTQEHMFKIAVKKALKEVCIMNLCDYANFMQTFILSIR